MRFALTSLLLSVLTPMAPATFTCLAQATCGPPVKARFDKVPTGPGVGEKIPPFSAPDQSGRMRDIESLRGPNGAVILFFRSADW